LPAPRPLRTGRETFASSGSGLGQRPCEIRPGAAPPSDDTSLTGRGCLIGLEDNLGVTAAEPATDVISVVQAAPAKTLAASRHFCDACCAGWLTVHARRHQREVCPLARGVMSPSLNPYPARYRPAFAFSLIRYPQPHRLALRLAFPKGGLRAYHVALLKSCVGGRSRPYAGGSSSAPGEFGAPGPGHLPFGPSLSAPLACSM
jgi:hypothetical protein